MPDPRTIAGAMLVLGPLVGVLGFYDTALWRVWMAPREEHLALVAAHRRGWTMLNAGFAIATIVTSGGVILLAEIAGRDDGATAVLFGAAVAYLAGGVLWCAVVAVRSRTTPTLAALVAAGTPTEPGETLLGAAMGGLFAFFCLTTSGSLIALGIALAMGDVIATPIAWSVAVVGALCTAWFLRAGDLIPAVLYLPTSLVGVAILAGWT
jgi:hypothetical protein